MTGEGKERKELPESEEELSLLLALAEQCRADGCLEAAFIFIKRAGNGAFGPARLLSSPPACLAAGVLGSHPCPCCQWERGAGSDNTHAGANNSSAHLRKAPSGPRPTRIQSVTPHRVLLQAASLVVSISRPISQKRNRSQTGDVIWPRSHRFQVAEPEGIKPARVCPLGPPALAPCWGLGSTPISQAAGQEGAEAKLCFPPVSGSTPGGSRITERETKSREAGRVGPQEATYSSHGHSQRTI